MKSGESGVPSIDEWLLQQLEEGSTVAGNSFLFSTDEWIAYKNVFFVKNISMEESIPDIIDTIWLDRPSAGNSQIISLPEEYTGVSAEDKLRAILEDMEAKSADYLLLTRLEEIAWVFNLRGNDIPFTPVFKAYAILGTNKAPQLFTNETAFRDDVNDALNPSGCSLTNTCVEVKPYESAREYLEEISVSMKMWLPSESTSYAMYNVVDPDSQISDQSPVKLKKTIKNEVEISGMKRAHVLDGLAVSEYISWLEDNVYLNTVNEITGAEKLEEFRLSNPECKGSSFVSISATGSNAAIIHYEPTFETNRNLSTNELYMIDSGGQYYEGTTDITRSVHFGTPTPKQKEMYTRALMGLIDLESLVFPYGKSGNDIDILVRRHIYRVGLNFRHGTGHGIGHYLAVHEYPPGIGTSATDGKTALQPGMFTSIEPGYYEDGNFGLRHENIAMVVKADTKYDFDGYEFYGFVPVTMVPFQRKMIDVDLMSIDQINYLNNYHNEVLEKVGEECKKRGKDKVLSWIENQARPLSRNTAASRSLPYSIVCFLVTISLIFIG